MYPAHARSDMTVASRQRTAYASALANRYAIIALESGHETRAVELLFDPLAAPNLELVVRPRGAESSRPGPED